MIPPEMRQAVVLTDGEIPACEFRLELARAIRDAAPWGQGFPEPSSRILQRGQAAAGRWPPHTKPELHRGVEIGSRGAGPRLDAIAFNREPPLVANAHGEVRMAYRFVVNAYRGEERPEIIVEEVAAAS